MFEYDPAGYDMEINWIKLWMQIRRSVKKSCSARGQGREIATPFTEATQMKRGERQELLCKRNYMILQGIACRW